MEEQIENAEPDENTKLDWNSARELAARAVYDGKLSRKEHFETIESLLESNTDQDTTLALAAFELFIKGYKDFDNEIDLDMLYELGERIARHRAKEFAEAVMNPVLSSRSIPAGWLDRVADEGSKDLRLAVAIALAGIAKLKSVPVERILGIAKYLMDEEDQEVRRQIASALVFVNNRNPEIVKSFVADHAEGAGTFRNALFGEFKSLIDGTDK